MKKAITQEENGIEISIIIEDDIENISPKSAMGGTATTAGKSLKKLSSSLDELGETISITCNRIENKIDKMNEQREKKSKITELTLEFGLSLTAEAGVVITSASAGATLKVSAKLKFD